MAEVIDAGGVSKLLMRVASFLKEIRAEPNLFQVCFMWVSAKDMLDSHSFLGLLMHS